MTFIQVNARLKNFLMGWLLVLGLKECLVECATLFVKSEVMLTYVNVQQTPNPAAQLPSTEPPFDEHSEVVKHVPYIVLSDLAVHWLWGKSKSF